MKRGTTLSSYFRSGLAASLTTLALTAPSTPLLAQNSLFNSWIEGQNFLVEFVDEKMTVKGNSIPVKALLLQIQEQTGIPVNFASDETETVTLDIYEQSIEQVVAKISDNHMIIHDHVDGIKTISELIIFSTGNTEVASTDSVTSEFLPSGEPAPLIAAAIADSENTQDKARKL